MRLLDLREWAAPRQLLPFLPLAAAMAGLCGCASAPPARPGHQPAERDLNAGYGLLFQILSAEVNVDKILIIKREQPELRALVKDIAAQASFSKKQLEALAQSDPGLNLKTKSLPLAEQKAREQISSARAKELVFGSSGREFEFKLLLTQVEALSYGPHLAKALSELEPDPKRKAYLLEVSRNFDQLYNRTLDFLLRRYRD